MATLAYEAVQRLLSEYTFRMENETLNEDLTCIICKNIMENAYQSYCGCRYCFKCIAKHLSAGEKYCVGTKVECREEFLYLEKNVTVNIALNRKILNVKVHCPNDSCVSVLELVKMEEHLRLCDRRTVDCPYGNIGCDHIKELKHRIGKHLCDEAFKHAKLLIEMVENLENENGVLKEEVGLNKIEIMTLKEQSRLKEIETEHKNREIEDKNREFKDMKREIEEIKREMRNKEETINQLKEKIEIINIGTNTAVAVGEICFTVDKFSERKMNDEPILSPYFYSHCNGYKLQLEVNPGGVGDGKNTHLSVFFIICKGEYDNMLSWPCNHVFKIAIFNQILLKEHSSETIKYLNVKTQNKFKFYKPTDKDNPGHGRTSFISHSELQSTSGLKVDDCIIIKCIVTVPI